MDDFVRTRGTRSVFSCRHHTFVVSTVLFSFQDFESCGTSMAFVVMASPIARVLFSSQGFGRVSFCLFVVQANRPSNTDDTDKVRLFSCSSSCSSYLELLALLRIVVVVVLLLFPNVTTTISTGLSCFSLLFMPFFFVSFLFIALVATSPSPSSQSILHTLHRLSLHGPATFVLSDCVNDNCL